MAPSGWACVSDRWIGESSVCWVCSNRDRLTYTTTMVYAGTLRGEGRGIQRVQLHAYVNLCMDCFVDLGKRGHEGMGWKPPDLGVTLAELLQRYPLDEECKVCNGGRGPVPEGGCYCFSGRSMLHGFFAGGRDAGYTSVARIGDGTLERVGPSPGPLYPASRPPAPLVDRPTPRATEQELSGPWTEPTGAGREDGGGQGVQAPAAKDDGKWDPPLPSPGPSARSTPSMQGGRRARTAKPKPLRG